jgi:hypothetical protein
VFFRRHKIESTTKRRPRGVRGQSRQASFESLEPRNLLAVVWLNEGNAANDSDSFKNFYGTSLAPLARSIVDRAVADWNRVITNFNYVEDTDSNPNNNLSNTFQLTLSAANLGPGLRGTTGVTSRNIANSPTAATIQIDDNGAGDVWFFDPTPNDDAEFTALVNSGMNGDGPAFAASFFDFNASADDFYRTVVHEIGHAMGIATDQGLAISTMLQPLSYDSAHTKPVNDPTTKTSASDPGTGTPLTRFKSTLSSPQFPNVTATLIGTHIYEGDIYDTNFDPTTVYPANSSAAESFVSSPNELMNAGRTVPAGLPNPVPPFETVRQFISDLDAKILADAYGYTVTLPSQINTAYASLDSLTGTLLVQGGVTSNGSPLSDTINIDTVTINNVANIRVQVSEANPSSPAFTTTELFPAAGVTQIVIAANGVPSGGMDPITVTPQLASIVKGAQYVVSSNQDSADAGIAVGDVFVDQSSVIPGRQVSLRAAIHDANGYAGGAMLGIYVPRGNYQLTIPGLSDSGIGDTVGDLDIGHSVMVLGTGAGETIIDAALLQSSPGDRVFEVRGGATLDLSGVTVTGGRPTDLSGYSGGGILVQNGAALKLSNSAVTGNSTPNDGGGGIYFGQYGGGSIVDCVITNNNASNGTGGGGGIALGYPSITPPPDPEHPNYARVMVANSIIARNFGGGDGRDIVGGNQNRAVVSGGDNLLTAATGTIGISSGLKGDFVNTNPTFVPYVVTDVADKLNTNQSVAFTLREAIQAANSTGGEIWVPGWPFEMTISGADGVSASSVDVTRGDFDVTRSMSIRGVGAGETIIDATPLQSTAASDRVFEILSGAVLTLSGVTVTGGQASAVASDHSGGGILVRDNGGLNLSQSAITGNSSQSDGGGGIYFQQLGGGSIVNSVISGNSASGGAGAGGGIALGYVNPSFAPVFVANSIIANNMGAGSGKDITGGSDSRGVTSGGNNLLTSAASHAGFTDGINGDVISNTANYVVTSLADTYDLAADGTYAPYLSYLSIRDTIAAADNGPGNQEIWIPAWQFVLTIDRNSAGHPVPDIDVSPQYGDLDITCSLTIRDAGMESTTTTQINWIAGVVDRVFELLGDYNGNGTVDAADYTVWRDTLTSTTDLRADGDDNGKIDPNDYMIWFHAFGRRTGSLMGDSSGDGAVDIADYNVWVATKGTTDLRADCNQDGVVNDADYDIWFDTFGSTLSVGQFGLLSSAFAPGTPPEVVGFALGLPGASTIDFAGKVGSGEQMRSVPLLAANTLSVTFNQNVTVTQSALQVINLDGASPSVSGFVYDALSQTATWTFTAALADGRYLVRLADSVHNSANQALDGEFTNPWTLGATGTSVFPSGDGVAGGEFRFRFTVMVLDSNHDNIVGSTNYQNWKSAEPGMIYVSTTADDYDADLSFGDVSLREAVDYANTASETTTIALPAGRYVLTRTGTEATDTAFNDLDALKTMSIIGAGPGLTIIDNSGLGQSLTHRAFDVTGTGVSLTLDGMTIINGAAASENGLAVRVNPGASAAIYDSVLEHHASLGGGPAIFVDSGNLTIRRSVITNNLDQVSAGAAVYVKALNGGSASVTIGETILALNQQHTYPADMTRNVQVVGNVTKTNLGGNLYDDATGGFFDTTPGTGDHLGSVNYIVTTVADTFDHSNDVETLSIREAVDLANQAAGQQEIWIPAWKFTLTRDRGTNATDTDVSYGDIDVKDSLVVRGVAGKTQISWKAGITDKVFELLGDYNGNGTVDAADYTVWQDHVGSTTDLLADGNDNGVVDQTDYQVWSDNYGHTLQLVDVGT